MNRSETLVGDCYTQNPELWKAAWRKYITRQLAQRARSFLSSISPLQIDPQIATIGQPTVRVGIVTVESAIHFILDEIAGPGEFRALAAASCISNGVGLPSRSKVENVLRPMIAASLTSREGTTEISLVADHEVYGGVADVLSEELFQLGQSGAIHGEGVILNQCLLIYHLRRWRFPFSQLPQALNDMNTGDLGLPGHVISIQNRHFASNNEDDFSVPVVPPTSAALPNAVLTHSNLLSAVQSESAAIAANAGFFHRALNINRPIDPQLLAQSSFATQQLVESGRRLVYTQYENTSLVLMSLASIEFLLRSFCPQPCAPDHPLEEVLLLHTQISERLCDTLKRIFSTDAWNIRNRCMHGSFLELEGRREDMLRQSGILSGHGVAAVDLSQDGSLPANVSFVILTALNNLALELERGGRTCDRQWAQHFLLTGEEIGFANSVRCDLLQNIGEAEAWRRHIRDYLRAVTPCLSSPLQIGMQSWVTPAHSIDSMPGFFFLMLLFEPFLRQTLLFAGRSVLQNQISGRGGVPHYRVQYKMMDENGLFTAANIFWLTEDLSPAEKPTAERVLRLAVKCRDAVAHGAVFDYTAEIRKVYGHLVIKAMQLVIEAGLRQLESTGSRTR